MAGEDRDDLRKEKIERSFQERSCFSCDRRRDAFSFGWDQCETCRSHLCRGCRQQLAQRTPRSFGLGDRISWMCPLCGHQNG